MRTFIIVTVQDEKKTYSYDIEVPTDIPVVRLKEHIEEVLNEYANKPIVSVGNASLYCVRLKKNLEGKETFFDAGIWNGDILIIK